jgi:hypothetical protein
MALNGAIVITVTKVLDPVKKAYTYNGTGMDMSIVTANLKAVYPSGTANEDSIYEMVDGTLLWGIEDFSQTTSELSATDRTGS